MASYQPTFPSLFVAPGLEVLRQTPPTPPVNFGRHLHAQSFVWPLVIVYPAPLIASGFLRARGRRGNRNGLFLVHTVELFMGCILFGMAWLDKLHLNA